MNKLDNYEIYKDTHLVVPYDYKSKDGEVKKVAFFIPKLFKSETININNVFGVDLSVLLSDLGDM